VAHELTLTADGDGQQCRPSRPSMSAVNIVRMSRT